MYLEYLVKSSLSRQLKVEKLPILKIVGEQSSNCDFVANWQR